MAARKKRSRVRLERAVIAVLVLCIGAELVYWFRHRAVPGADVSAPEWVEQDILPLNPYSRPGTPLETIDGVVVHYVGNPGTSAAANRSFFANLALTHETYASAHFIVGLEGEVLQCVPLAEIAYCSSQANDHTVSIEVCHADEAGEFSAETMASLLRLTAWLCEEFDLAPADVIRHYDVTGKDCPKWIWRKRSTNSSRQRARRLRTCASSLTENTARFRIMGLPRKYSCSPATTCCLTLANTWADITAI